MVAPEQAHAEGTTIGSYRIVKKLGQGGMGAVYVAEHALLGRRAAIKVLLPQLSANDEIVRRFFNEAKAVTQIADPGIVQVFDFGFHTDKSAFIVMELLEGEPLDRRLERQRRIAVPDALRLMRMICGSLGAAHGKGIVHRDLKPENIFIVVDPAVHGGERPKILDFGIAKLSTEEAGTMKTQTGMLMGTPVYMSPEQCKGAGEVDHRSDIYSIGCVMFTMITGRPPFEGEGVGELIAAHLREPPPFAAALVPGLPRIVDDVLQGAMAKALPERFQTMAHLVTALEQAELECADTYGATYHAVPAGPGYVGMGTPRPGMRATPPAGVRVPTPVPGYVPTPTTLSHANGEASAPVETVPPRASRRALHAALAVVAIAIAGGTAFFAVRGGDDEPVAASGSSPAPAITVTMPDAAPAAIAQPVARPDAAPAAAPVPAPEVAASDPGPDERKKKKKKRTPRGGTDVKPTAPDTFDRGD
jgi:serine/threonine-protein kinase